jgi:hypothetical protein
VFADGCAAVGPDFKTPDVTREDQWYENLLAAAQGIEITCMRGSV